MASDVSQDPQDCWELREHVLVRHHVVPRRRMFVPTDSLDDLPVPLGEVDATRQTFTNLEAVDQSEIKDVWSNREDDRR